jgi:hypothetical protein
VRGDSLRDFQAKVLAIAGLGVLAGVGALVDYWPTGANVPAIARTRVARPEVPVPTPASVAAARQKDAIDASAPIAAVAIARRAQPTAQPAALKLDPVVTVAATGAMPIGQAVPLSPVEIAVAQMPTAVPVPATDPPAQVISLPGPPAVSPVDREMQTPGFTPTFAAADNEPGFVMGTLRKTGSGIAKGGAVTGASIMDAFRGVAGAFKKVSPFKDRGFIASN